MFDPPPQSDSVGVVDAAAPNKATRSAGLTDWRWGLRRSRVGALLTSFPSRVFGLALVFYLLLTWLYYVLFSHQPLPGAFDLAGWSKAVELAWRHNDSYYFLRIAQYGYNQPLLYAFFPLYPLLIRLGAWPLGDQFGLAALLVSWVCCWGSYLWLYRLAEREYGTRTARLALLFLACCPLSFFSFAIYSESVFLLVSIGAVERARAGHLWQAGALGALGMLARPTGLLLLIPLGWEWLRRSVWGASLPAWLRARLSRWRAPSAGAPGEPQRDNPLPRLAWLSLGLIPLALLGYMLFLYRLTGNALAFLASEAAWHRHFTFPWQTVGFFARSFQHGWLVGDYGLLMLNVIDLLPDRATAVAGVVSYAAAAPALGRRGALSGGNLMAAAGDAAQSGAGAV